MSLSSNVGYCNYCEQNVLLKREEFDVCLAIILLFFTAGIGLLIYLAIYYSKPPDRCVHCNTICLPGSDDQQQVQTSQNPYVLREQQQNQIKKPQNMKKTDNILEYCGFCGENIEPGAKFCKNCGTKL
ncbi:MAG: zinc ribbon domain-containing protein [Candidatus Lokiarchaeota archaeon]|nr:zinc ribbon domain-containing protein [Candidatus Lokiarchaeota archaeon]